MSRILYLSLKGVMPNEDASKKGYAGWGRLCVQLGKFETTYMLNWRRGDDQICVWGSHWKHDHAQRTEHCVISIVNING